MKKTIVALILVLSLVSLCACGTQTPAVTTEPATEEQPATEKNDTVVVEISAEYVSDEDELKGTVEKYDGGVLAAAKNGDFTISMPEESYKKFLADKKAEILSSIDEAIEGIEYIESYTVNDDLKIVTVLVEREKYESAVESGDASKTMLTICFGTVLSYRVFSGEKMAALIKVCDSASGEEIVSYNIP